MPSRSGDAPSLGAELGVDGVLLKQILPNCALHEHRVSGDDRGSLISLQTTAEIPFEIKRVYVVYDTKPLVERGHHAHKSLEQWIVCVAGSCMFTVDDGIERREVLLDNPNKGLHIGNGIWREMRHFAPGTALVVLASTLYDLEDYIRDYDDFLAYARGEMVR
ncbi:sugar 3,4-ketoisomerase [Sphingomonas daechungensis]|uniref:sugar 3,4-ketoisomerase n=1 Tax=Sphingomonas daechungensis TaxID=1176646 RepID=UPI003783A258